MPESALDTKSYLLLNRAGMSTKLASVVVLTCLWVLPARGEDWKTADGKIYRDVQVIKTEDDAVTILYKDGGARIFLWTLPVDLQKRFKFDPIKAVTAAMQRSDDEKDSAEAMQNEKEQADEIKKLGGLQTLNFKKMLLQGAWQESTGGQLTFDKEFAHNTFPWKARWSITGIRQVTLILDWPNNALNGKTAVLNFNPNVSAFRGSDFNGETLVGSEVDLSALQK